MALWLVIGAMTAVAVWAALRPLGRDHGGEGEATSAALYRARLDEIEEERRGGLLDDASYRNVRAEVARRLIAEDAREERTRSASLWSKRAAAGLLLAGIPVLSLSTYVLLGSPTAPDQPIAARLEGPADASIDTLIARVEERLRAQPDDPRGWTLIAPVYMRLGRYDDAATAYGTALRLSGDNAGLSAGLGEAIVAREGGLVTAKAEAAFRRATSLDPREPKSRFFLALAKQQSGDVEGAVTDWQRLLAEAPADAPWRRTVQAALTRVGESAAAAPSPGPSAEDVAAASEMPSEDRQAMILSMVEGLSTRLEADPSDARGWQRLIRSYVVLGRSDDAQTALEQALAATSAEDARAEIVSLGTSLGLRVEGAR